VIYQLTVLPNGLRVISEELPHVRSVAVGIWVGAGSRHEPPELAGVSHFIEHLLFKGTEWRTARQIAEEMDAIGGQLNAFTGKECTCFYARVLDEHFARAVDILAEMVLHPRLDPGDIEKEKNVVAEEIAMYEDTPEDLVHDVLGLALWPRDGLGRPVQGFASTVRALTRAEVLAYYERFYTPGNMVVAAAGNVAHERVVAEVARRFAGRAGRADLGPAGRPVAAPGSVYREKDIEQIHLCLGVASVPLGDPRLQALYLLSNILGGGTSSRLFQEIREERALAYSVYSFHSAFRDAGLTGVYLATSPASAAEAFRLARAEIARLAEKGVDEQELRRGKDHLKATLLLGLESTSSRMTHLGKSQLLLERVLTPEEIGERIEKVTAEEVRDLARALWQRDGVATAAVGPASRELERVLATAR